MKVEYTAPQVHNPKAERINRTIKEKATTIQKFTQIISQVFSRTKHHEINLLPI